MAKKKKKSDEDFITEAVLAATKRRISKMSGAEIKASVDRMAAQEKQFSSDWSRGTRLHDSDIDDWEDKRLLHDRLNEWLEIKRAEDPDYPDNWDVLAPAPPKVREQEYGPWQKGRPYFESTAFPGPYPYEGTTELWGQGHSYPMPMARPKEGPGSDMASVDLEDVHRAVMGNWPPRESVVLPSGRLNNEQIKRDIEEYRRMEEAYPNDNEMERFLKGRSPAEVGPAPEYAESIPAQILKEAYRQETDPRLKGKGHWKDNPFGDYPTDEWLAKHPKDPRMPIGISGGKKKRKQ